MKELHVVFRVAGADYILAAADVLQMESYAGATPVPGAVPYLVGVVQVRGKVLPVVSLRARFGLPPVESTIDSRIVVVQRGERAVALLVDSAREVVKLDPSEVLAPPRVVADEAQGWVRGVVRLDGRILMLLDIDKTVGEDVSHGERR